MVDPVKTIERSNVYARVVAVLGTIKVNGWTNGDQKNSFWSSIQYSSLPPTIEFSANYAYDYWANYHNASEFFANQYVHGGGINQINSQYAGDANQKLVVLIASITAVQQPDTNIANFLIIGKNTVDYSVIGTTSLWTAEFQLYTKDKNGNVNFIQQTQLSNTNPNQALPITLIVVENS
jgi:hypothetical protein